MWSEAPLVRSQQLQNLLRTRHHRLAQGVWRQKHLPGLALVVKNEEISQDWEYKRSQLEQRKQAQQQSLLSSYLFHRFSHLPRTEQLVVASLLATRPSVQKALMPMWTAQQVMSRMTVAEAQKRAQVVPSLEVVEWQALERVAVQILLWTLQMLLLEEELELVAQEEQQRPPLPCDLLWLYDLGVELPPAARSTQLLLQCN